MKYSQATNYALHTMLYFVALSPGTTIGVQKLAELQGVSPAYLSKILSRLVKAGLIESTSGINGGYRLTSNRADLSFLDVIQAIEGTASLFHCGDGLNHQTCLIQGVMTDAEHLMEDYLKRRKLIELIERRSGLPRHLEQMLREQEMPT
ncbi:BadM/Rrf2 family transcriptional regulator [Thermosporothrix hazakensis]|jgi:Rrf2 family protein|uniref:BadM/Rrf2 family transcriptional regulator n=2 Tax=Thermosporothrix TaxID=768650 RepID=A0A326U1H0_THEHA|nr:Rrf2 family transcriptional regulator [Thermosporothrix hazakensis]PZW24030.1 BadM/Rrf2 family transcriptional regulator [Thermosporothrix hazakensis]BBH87818.1 Rrf2 family transcriptional regulator [Thermosporothrix sp. COM3]GCE50246.1 Rrf2 family transcriptional regulator [Thermosporothrix hazakensis]